MTTLIHKINKVYAKANTGPVYAIQYKIADSSKWLFVIEQDEYALLSTDIATLADKIECGYFHGFDPHPGNWGMYGSKFHTPLECRIVEILTRYVPDYAVEPIPVNVIPPFEYRAENPRKRSLQQEHK